jgi:hypothetical protein
MEGCGIQPNRRPWDKEVLVVVREQDGTFCNLQRLRKQAEEMSGKKDACRKLGQAPEQPRYRSFRIKLRFAKNRIEGFFFSACGIVDVVTGAADGLRSEAWTE